MTPDNVMPKQPDATAKVHEDVRSRIFEVEVLIRTALEQIGSVSSETITSDGQAISDAMYVLQAASKLANAAARQLES